MLNTSASNTANVLTPPARQGDAKRRHTGHRLVRQWLVSALLATPALATAAATPVLPTQEAEHVATVVREFLQSAASSYPGSVLITVDASRIARQPACSQLQPYLTSGQRLRSRLSVGVRCMAPTAWNGYVQANLSIQGFYYVANRAIQPGDVISLDDLSAREGDLLKLSPGIVTDPSQLIGHLATQRINTGTPIKASAMRDPDSIQRGQMIRTEVRGPGFIANGEGQAMQSGSPGTQIQIKSSSGQVITGTVLNATTVLVM
ncbi:MAG: flagellar basal body P-ring formation protein FlgA [Burkholderiaceae bacterium]|nr:flagellar basal body P-ring formation protein FlgA [Burkholderiaceae bacterium]